MRLYKCLKVEHFLLEEKLVDERKLWCYAQMKTSTSDESTNYYGFVLVCIRNDQFFIFVSKYNNVDLDLFCSFAISEMKHIQIKKGWPTTRLSFSIDNRNIQLDLDDWKRISVGVVSSP